MTLPADPWFSVDRLDPATYALSEYGHWEHTHQYLFIGRERAALVDSGLGVADIRAVVDALTDLPVLVLTTHAHWDHTGGHGRFAETAVHADDADWLAHGLPLPLEVIRRDFLKEPLSKVPPAEFDPARYTPYTGAATHLLRDEQRIDLGGRVLTILHTPGHAPGHICIYEQASGYLATGDLLYEGELHAFYESTDPVAFRASIERIAALPHVTRLLPGHHRLDIPVTYLAEAREAFAALAACGQLRHGSGLHHFAHINIRL